MTAMEMIRTVELAERAVPENVVFVHDMKDSWLIANCSSSNRTCDGDSQNLQDEETTKSLKMSCMRAMVER